jgi:predicted alpha/beta-fold hydrolase
VSAPLDLAQGGVSLSSGFNMLYTRMFLQTLKPKCVAKLQQFPGLFDRRPARRARPVCLRQRRHRAAARLPRHRRLLAPRQRQARPDDITVPTLVLNAKNDPFLPGRHLPQRASSRVVLDYPEHGGHVGFAVGGRRAASTGCRS